MSPRLRHYADVEAAHDDPERIGRLAGAVDALRDGDALVVGAGDDTGPSALALVTDAYRRVTGADVGYLDTRMLREGAPLAGEVTAADLVGTVPFEAPLRVLSVAGATLRTLLAEAVLVDDPRADRSPVAEAWCGQFSGATVTWNRRERRLESVAVGGDPLGPAATYRVATTAYVVESDEFPAVDPGHVVGTWGPQYEAVLAGARSGALSLERDGRITVLEA